MLTQFAITNAKPKAKPYPNAKHGFNLANPSGHNDAATADSWRSIWGGTPEWGEGLKRRIRKEAQSDIPVALASDAVVEGLKRHGVKKKIAVMEPYYPSIEPRMRGVLGPHGYEIVRFNHMRGKSPASYSILTARDMIQAIKAIDGPDIEAIVQFGANLPMARLADEAERWLDKPVISVNVATYWHACRMNKIDDKLYGFTQLFSRF